MKPPVAKTQPRYTASTDADTAATGATLKARH